MRLMVSPTDKNVDEVVRGFNKALEGSNLNVVYTGYCDNWLAELAGNHVNKGLEVTRDNVWSAKCAEMMIWPVRR